jgi:hypothetical protein
MHLLIVCDRVCDRRLQNLAKSLKKARKLRLFANVAGLEGCRFGCLGLLKAQHSTHVPN